jgi:hypothetical protein
MNHLISGGRMDKYLQLTKYLQDSKENKVTLTFSEVEYLIGSKLPESAYKRLSWWGNDATHAQAIYWLDAGYQTINLSTSIPDHIVEFKRVG